MITSCKKVTTLIFTLYLSFSGTYLLAQEATPKNNRANRTSKLIQEKAGRPDLPGDLMIEFGFNWMQEHPKGIKFKTGGSRTFNAYYLFDKNIGESAFSIHPGFGVGTEKYKFEDDLTIGYERDQTGQQVMRFIPLDSIYGRQASYSKSQINANYFDIPLEIRWRSRVYDPKRSFKVALGGKFGLLFDSKTKVKYESEGETKITKQKEKFEINQIRYGTYLRLGYGGFSAYTYWSLSDTFNKDKGPMNTTMYPITFGVSLALF